jgi:membrane-associated protease RseP (regulator of RpoE activity)
MRTDRPAEVPVASLKNDWLDRLLISSAGRSLVEIEKEISATLEPRSRVLPGWKCQLETDVTHNTITVKNVVGVLEGKGPLAKETVVVGAHYDHIGMGMSRTLPARNPQANAPRAGRLAGPGAPGGVGFPMASSAVSAVHHGADDNASGSVAVMELARRFAAIKDRQGRRLVFICFTAEESGLIGSAHYAKAPLFPLADTVAMINMDMVGRLQNDRLLVSGLGTSKLFSEMVDRLNARHRFSLDRENAGNGPSDHSSFFNVGVPVLNFFTGFHEQYHRPTDRLETINVAGLRRVSDLVGDLMDELSQAPSRPVFIKATAQFDRTKTLWSMAPSTGIIPKYTDNRDGMLVDGVVAQSAAAKAGLKKGDRVIAAGGERTLEAGTFLRLSRLWKPGTKVELVVLRDGKEQKLALELAQAPRGMQRGGPLGLVVDFRNQDEVQVGSVTENGPAAKAGVKAGDRIVAVAGKEVGSTRDFLLALRDVQPGAKVALTISRDGKTTTLTVTTEAARQRGQ